MDKNSNKRGRHSKNDGGFFAFLKPKAKEENTNKKPKKPMSRKTKITMITLISVASTLLAVLIALLIFVLPLFMAAKDSHDDGFKAENLGAVEQKDENIYNIALFGVDTDTPGSYVGRTDSMMILSIDMKDKEIKIISLMRDTLVEINRVRVNKDGTQETIKTYNKLNSAYAFGKQNPQNGELSSPELAVKTINETFGLDITEYALVNFYGMAEIIDEVGGVEIDVQQKEINAKNGVNDNIRDQASFQGLKNPPLVTKPGLQRLSGIQAVAWARIRSVSTAEGVSNDYGRTDRQRVVMEALLKEALSQNLVSKTKTVEKLLSYCKTSLSFDEMLKLAKTILTKDVQFSQTRVPQSKYTITPPKIQGVGSTVYFNLEFASDIIHAFIYDDITQDEYLETHEIVKEGWYRGPTVSSSQSNNSSEEDDVSDTTPSDNTSSDNTSSDGTSTDITSSDEESSDDSSNGQGSDGGSSDGGSSGDSSPESSTPTGGEPDQTPPEGENSEPSGNE